MPRVVDVVDGNLGGSDQDMDTSSEAGQAAASASDHGFVVVDVVDGSLGGSDQDIDTFSEAGQEVAEKPHSGSREDDKNLSDLEQEYEIVPDHDVDPTSAAGPKTTTK